MGPDFSVCVEGIASVPVSAKVPACPGIFLASKLMRRPLRLLASILMLLHFCTIAPEELAMRGEQRIAEGHQPLVHLG